MGLVAINTVEIIPANGSAAALQVKLEGLLEVLNRTSGCVAYSLKHAVSSDERWIITGHWDCVERMTAHFHLQCLSVLFDLVAERRVTGLCFRRFMASSQ
ncbi:MULTISPECIES: hypothetical protein [unclassified Pseudomonas]|uniref:hypothetical protein n=1 Tax=unclassified Pseudomonas TaxID=196821 RepID=UPI002446A7DF|nr:MULTISPECIES: hypothetical protein [unclassified Pseudomonas]MDH0302909.1 hypothetical protein [Pseudomonas sp. GD04091]MDH1985486.1 hypothetical protein [Pseudomonas sp. GD03689]